MKAANDVKGFNISFLCGKDNLLYQAFVIDENFYYPIPTEFFNYKIDPLYNDLFTQLIEGNFNISYIDTRETRKYGFPIPHIIEIDNPDCIQNFIDFQQLPTPITDLKISIEEIH